MPLSDHSSNEMATKLQVEEAFYKRYYQRAHCCHHAYTTGERYTTAAQLVFTELFWIFFIFILHHLLLQCTLTGVSFLNLQKSTVLVVPQNKFQKETKVNNEKVLHYSIHIFSMVPNF